MRRTGDGAWRLAAGLALLLGTAARAEVEFYQTVDRKEVGTEDTFHLTVVISGAPEGARLEFPAPKDFEVLSSSQSTETSFHFGGGQSSLKQVQKHVLVMRADRPGPLVIPPAVLKAGGKTYTTDSIKMDVKKGRTEQPQRPSRPGGLPDPFRNFPFPAFPNDPFGGDDFFPEPEIPRSDSDLFVRSHLDREEVYVGEQITWSVHIFSRVDLSGWDPASMPKFDGFWSEDLDSPTQAIAERKLVGGVPYKAYLLRRRALFPVKEGTLTIEPVEINATTGVFFAGHRVHRRGNVLTVKVKPLPPGAPAGFAQGNIGSWRLSSELSQTEVRLGEPVTVRVVLEGRGNLKNVTLPKLSGPVALKVYEPTTTDKLATSRGQLGGRRVQEYLVMPQRTGSFTLPGLTFAFFDPASGAYEESRTDPVTITVMPNGQGANAIASGNSQPSLDPSEKNQLEPAGLKPLRYRATFQPPGAPVWSRPFFLPVALAPLGLWVGLGLFGLVRGALGREDEASRKKKQARAARARLAAAEKLKGAGADAFYGEVEKALLTFLEAKLGPVKGLTRPQLDERMTAGEVTEERRKKVLGVLESCEAGRFAPGGGNATRSRVLDHAVEAMGGWE